MSVSSFGATVTITVWRTLWLIQMRRWEKYPRITVRSEPRVTGDRPDKAGVQITPSRLEEVVMKNNNRGLFRGPVIGMTTL